MKEIHIKNFDKSVRPQDDFFDYFNNRWIKDNPIPDDESRWGPFDELRKKVRQDIKKILEAVKKKKNAKKGSPEQLVRDFYVSGMNIKSRNARGTTPLTPYFDCIEKIEETHQIGSLLGKLHALGVSALFSFEVEIDLKNTSKHMLYVGQGGLTLPDRDYYFRKDAATKKIQKAYDAYRSKLLKLSQFSPKERARISKNVLKIERALAEASLTATQQRDIEKLYHPHSPAQYKKLAPLFDWGDYFDALGIKDTKRVVFEKPSYFKDLQKLLRSQSLRSIKDYLLWATLDDFSPFLTTEITEARFNFYGKHFSGAKKMKEEWERVQAVLGDYIGEALGKLYTTKHFPPQAKAKMETISKSLFVAFASRIKRLEWMSNATKKRALQKLKNMKCLVGYPDKWETYRGLLIEPDGYFENIVRAQAFHHKKELSYLGKKVERDDWHGIVPQTVNAYCAFLRNRLFFPAGILQSPIFTIGGDDAINYGAIGATIGHEITHGFDDKGAGFDENGNMREWWSKSDRKQFNKKAAVMRKQGDTFHVIDDLKLNGQLTLGENIADLGGLLIAYQAYQESQKGKKRKNINGFTPEQRVFMGWALFERGHARKEFSRMMVHQDPHSPGKFRTNNVFSNMQEFYDAFDVDEGDKLYRRKKERVDIW